MNTMADTFRKEYAPLTEEQKNKVTEIKEKAEELETLMLGEKSREPRLMSIALTNLELSVMAAVKAVTTKEPEGGR